MLEAGHGETYYLRMPVRLLRKIVSVLIVATYVSATIFTTVSSVNAAPHAMNGGGMMMNMGKAGDHMPMPCSKGMKSGCATDLGCVFLVSLPAAYSSIMTMIEWSMIAYAADPEFLSEHSIKPPLDPPISRA
jgi:hypothetical protein